MVVYTQPADRTEEQVGPVHSSSFPVLPWTSANGDACSGSACPRVVRYGVATQSGFKKTANLDEQEQCCKEEWAMRETGG